MFIGLTLPVFILGSLALALADYLYRKFLAPPVPATIPLSEPYTPPFIGGQCQVQYRVRVSRRNLPADWVTLTGDSSADGYILAGSIGGIRVFQQTSIQILSNGTWRSVNEFSPTPNREARIDGVTRVDNLTDSCGDIPNPVPTLPIGGGGLAQSPPPVLYPPPNSPPDTPPTTPNNNWFPLIAGIAAVAATALTAATAAAAATAATAVTAATAAATAATAAIASAPSGSTIQQQAQSQKLSADALVGIAQLLAEIAKQISELEKEIRKLKSGEAKTTRMAAKTVVRYDFGGASKDGFITLYPDLNPSEYQATFVDLQIFNIPSGSGKFFGKNSPHWYRYKSLGQIHFVSPTFGILESREIDFARLSLTVPPNASGFFYHFGLDGVIESNISCFYIKTTRQAS